jgi:phosphoglycerate dehydrogenase-like enzyme
MKVGILDYSSDADIEQGVLGSDADVECFGCIDETQLPDEVSSLAAVMVWHTITVGAQTIDRLTSCRVIVRVGAGYDNVDLAAAAAAGIPVVTVPDYGTNEVADHAMALLLALHRRLPVYHDALRRDGVSAWQPDIAGRSPRLAGRTLGIVGMGRIGTAMALRARAFGLLIACFDPYLADGYDKSLQVTRVASVAALAAQSDYFSIHAPLTRETRGMVDDRLLCDAKRGMTLINVARGGIVCLDAVAAALANGQLAAFGADVLESEPPSSDHPLIRAYTTREPWLDGRMLLTPHAAFQSIEAKIEMRTTAARRMLDALRGVPLRNCVNAHRLSRARTAVAPAATVPWEID